MNEKNKSNKTSDTHDNKSFNLTEFSRETSIRIELLRRIINRHTRQVRAETWDKFYPSLMELFGENTSPSSRRIGPPYRRHAELVEMFSDQKVLLDVYNVLPPDRQQELIKKWGEMSKSTPTVFTSLSADENKLMGSFLAFEEERREQELLSLIQDARQLMNSMR